MPLTLGSPHRLDHVILHHEEDGGDDDGRQRRLRDEFEVLREELQS